MQRCWLLLLAFAPLVFFARPRPVPLIAPTPHAAEPPPPSVVVEEHAPAVVDLGSNPEVAPALVHTIAALGFVDRDRTARRLAQWLAEESARDTADARGNVPNLIEALGEVGGDVATAALVEALDERDYDLALQTLIVQQLGERAPPEAVARFAARAARAPAHDDFETELRDEALAMADESGRLNRRTP